MARLTPQWLQAGSYPGGGDRALLTALYPAAASTGCAVSAGAGMSVNIAAGSVAVPSASGTVLCTSTAVETITLDPAPPSGTDRQDLVICRPRSVDLGTGSQEDFIFDKVAGAQGTPPGVVPSTPAGTVCLATVHVRGGAANVAAGDITDARGVQGLAVPPQQLLAVAYAAPASQGSVQIGGAWGIWGSFGITFTAPPSGIVLLDAEHFLYAANPSVCQFGWEGGGLGTAGLGPGKCPTQLGFQPSPASAVLAARIHLMWRVTGLNPGQTYTPGYYSMAGAGGASWIYWGGPGTSGVFSNNAGPAIFTARAGI